MKPATVPISSAYQGDPWVVTLRFWSDETKTARLPLTGRSYEGQVYDEEENVWEFAFDNNDLSNGEVLPSLTALQTAELPASAHYFIKETVGAGEPHTIFRGAFYTEQMD